MYEHDNINWRSDEVPRVCHHCSDGRKIPGVIAFKDKFAKALSMAVQKSRRLILTFKPRGVRDGLDHLLELLQVKAITIAEHNREFLLAVRNTGDWEGDQNRKFSVDFTLGFTLERAFHFSNRMADVLEDVEAVW